MPYGLDAVIWEQIRKTLFNHPGVTAAVLFGSRATGRFRAGSDIDIMIEGRGLSLKDLNQTSLRLDELMLPYKFDLVLKTQIQDSEVLKHIAEFGIPIKVLNSSAST